MPDPGPGPLCPNDILASELAALQAAPPGDLTGLDTLLARYSTDPRLYFLKGSFLASAKDYAAARAAMRRALDLAPDFTIARFQLGFLHLTSGEPIAAQETWGPLQGFPEGHYIRHFVRGLCHLIRDEFSDALRQLELGIAANTENPPLNNDMRLIINEVRSRSDSAGEDDSGETSSAQALLQQAALRSTMH